MMTSGSIGRPWGLVAALVLAVAALVIYILVLQQEGNDTLLEVAPFMIPHFAGIVFVAAGILTQGRTQNILAIVAGVLFILLGFLAMFSFGLLLMVAGIFCLLELRRTHGEPSVSNGYR